MPYVTPRLCAIMRAWTFRRLSRLSFGRFDELERRFGIRRSKAYELIEAGKIKSACVRKKGERFGIR
jgi:hypothetical protein